MSAVAKLFDAVSGAPVARAESKLESLRKKLSDAEAKRNATAAEIETTRASLRGAVAEDGADPGLLAGRIGKLRAEHAAAEELVAVLKDAVSEAEIGVRAVKERVEREEVDRLVAAAAAAATKAEGKLEPLFRQSLAIVDEAYKAHQLAADAAHNAKIDLGFGLALDVQKVANRLNDELRATNKPTWTVDVSLLVPRG